ncbi:unnamed protein product [marine sediment metagenome]|uniref:Uncharacterized protein n=1 Tax=marine sediment metagenome TaxID=412755 RepID=X1JHJ4_9ZZZZ
MFNFFKKNNKTVLVDLEKTEKEGLITREEFLELKIKRTQRELDDLKESKKGRKK